MRRRLLGPLLGVLLLVAAPGCHTVGGEGAVAGSVAIDFSGARIEEPPPSDAGSPAQPMHPCRR